MSKASNKGRSYWHKEYKRLLIKMAGLTEQQAKARLSDGVGEFDYGYSPIWYVREELYCYVFGGANQ